MTRPRTFPAGRRGSSFLEVQVAAVVFAIALSGMAPLMVLNTRQAAALRQSLPDNTPHYLRPTGEWRSKLGGSAEVHDAPVAPTDATTLVDDGDSSYAEQGEYIYRYTSASTHGSDFRYFYSFAALPDHVEWELDLPPGVYQVEVTFPTASFLTTDARYQIYDDTSLIGVSYINQVDRAEGNSDSWGSSGPIAGNTSSGGLTWTSLGIFTVSSETLRVRMSSAVSDWTTADALRVIPLRNSLELQSITRDRENDSISTQVSVTP